MIHQRILYSIYYRLKKLNKRIIIGKNNKITNNSCFKGCTVEIFGNNNSVILENDALIINSSITIKGNNNTVRVGSNTRIKNAELWLEDNGGNLIFGAKTTIESAHIGLTEDNSTISIGEDCMIANNIDIRNGDSHAIYNSNNQRINKAKNITIGNHVWIANNVTVLKGAFIANDCIVGANTFITSSVSTIPNALYTGNPAILKKENITWSRSRK